MKMSMTGGRSGSQSRQPGRIQATPLLFALAVLACAKGDPPAWDGGAESTEDVPSTAATALGPAPAPALDFRPDGTDDPPASGGGAGSVVHPESQPRPGAPAPEGGGERPLTPPELQAYALADAPLAPMGQEIGRSPLESAPGYTPPDDPEADAVRTGRRMVGPIDIPFTGGAASPESLAEAILDDLARGDRHALHGLLITQSEFAEILWPEFPESRPITNLRAEDAWEFHHRESSKGLAKALSQWTGRRFRLHEISCEIGRMPFTNFTLYKGVVLHVLDESGERISLSFAEYFAERDGAWKVYLYKER